LIPSYKNIVENTQIPHSEEAMLELGCVYNKIDTIVIAGHSDCKAMNLVYDSRNDNIKNEPQKEKTVLKTWLMGNTQTTVSKYFELEKDFTKPLKFSSKFGIHYYYLLFLFSFEFNCILNLSF
jgi:carbonic anhydrase